MKYKSAPKVVLAYPLLLTLTINFWLIVRSNYRRSTIKIDTEKVIHSIGTARDPIQTQAD